MPVCRRYSRRRGAAQPSARVFGLAPRLAQAHAGVDAEGQGLLLACMAVIHPPVFSCTGDQQVHAVQVGILVAAGPTLVDGMAEKQIGQWHGALPDGIFLEKF